MRPAHPLEREVGVAYYVSDADGTGGRLRQRDADFRVRERERFDAEPLDADPDAYPHLVFRATLSGWDTNDFASEVSNALGISRERLSWAGTKDKRAVTTQLFSVRAPGLAPEDLPAVGGAEIEPVGRAGRPIGFGDLAGNEFEVVVRDAERLENVEPIAAELREFGSDGGRVGIPNYFGQQRFGSKRPITHEVGLRIVRGDWQGAVFAYLGNPREAEPEETREARSFVERELRGGSGDFAAALERFPDRLRYERAMLHHLAEDGTEDYRAALGALPSNLRRLFVNAAQSYAFNRILSERLERGLPFHRAREGDVVCFADAAASDGLAVPDTDRLQRVSADRVDTINRHCERGRAFVTAPLLGTETDLADGEQGAIERAVFDDLDLSPDDFDLPGEFRSTGTRRAILARTDLRVDRDPLTFSFALPSGSYATVLLREFLKADPDALT